jgi:hypothetical protein
MFRTGMKVVCVDDAFEGGSGHEVLPVKGRVYTVREMLWCDYWMAPHVRLVEIVNPGFEYLSGTHEPSWYVRRFRPVKTTSIEVFLNMLEPEPNAPARVKVSP